MDRFYCDRKYLCDKENHAFLTNDQADTRHKMGIHKWSENPGTRTLKIAEGDPSFKIKLK